MSRLNRRDLLKTAGKTIGILWLSHVLPSCSDSKVVDEPPIRLGWQTAWAAQGQVIEALMRTNIPKLAGVQMEFKGFQFGPDLNEAAIGNSIDVANAGIVPVINLLAKSPNWAIIGRQTDFRVSIIAHPESQIHEVADLKRKRFAVPIGGGSHPFAVEQLRLAGLSDNDTDVINVPPTEMLLAFKKREVAAVAIWDPVAQLIKEEGGITIAEKRYVGFITANKELVTRRKSTVSALLEAYGLAYFYAAQNKTTVDGWFARDSGMPKALVERLEVIEPNFNSRSLAEIKLTPTDEAITLCQSVADQMLLLNILKAKVDIKSRIIREFSINAENNLQTKHAPQILKSENL